MGLALAIKRGYRCFIPSAFFEPGKLAKQSVRELCVPAIFYFFGFSAGVHSRGSSADFDQFSGYWMVALVAIYLLKQWADTADKVPPPAATHWPA